MKGFQQKTSGDGNFFVVKHGSIVRESKTPQEGFEKIEIENRRTKEKVTKYIQRYNAIEALITKIEWYDTEQKFDIRYRGWKIHLTADGGKKGILDIPINSRVAGRFMKLAENIDYSKPVEFRAWLDPKSDSTAFFVGQDGNSVPQKYTKDNPGDMPPPVQKFNGDWSFDDQMQFLHKKMLDVVIPKVQALNPVEEKPDGQEAKPEHEDFTESDDEPVSTVLKSIQGIIRAVAGKKEAHGRTKSELLMDYFGSADWGEIEKMPEATLRAGLAKLDELVPF